MEKLLIDQQTALMVFQLLTLLITIIGWIYTGSQQRSILRELEIINVEIVILLFIEPGWIGRQNLQNHSLRLPIAGINCHR